MASFASGLSIFTRPSRLCALPCAAVRCANLRHQLNSSRWVSTLGNDKSKKTDPSFVYQHVFEQPNKPAVVYRKLDHLSSKVRLHNFQKPDGKTGTAVVVDPQVLTDLTKEAMLDIAFLLRPSHLRKLTDIVKDPEASVNDRFVTLELLKNASIASNRVLPGCQDTGTAIVIGKKSQYVWTDEYDEKHISKGVYDAYLQSNLRYSQMSPVDMFTEKNTSTNLPAQIEIYSKTRAEDGATCTGLPNSTTSSYDFLFIAKGGGSANKTMLYQQTKAILNPIGLEKFIVSAVKSLGTAACPPYHLAIVIGGSSAEQTLKTVKLASCKYLDGLHTTGNELGRAFRDREWERKILEITRGIGIGAQFGGKYFCHDVRVIRLPRHGASCPVGIGVSCSADRQVLGKITKDGVFLEQLEENPTKYLAEIVDEHLEDNSDSKVVSVDLTRPMAEILKQLSAYRVTTRLALTGTLIVARDMAHAKILEGLQTTGSLPEYMKKHPIYYAGPAKTPEGLPSGSFGPTTAGRMDSYVAPFMAAGGSMITLAKGNRSSQVTEACKKFGGFYLGSIGGPAASLAQNHIKKVEVLEFPEFGMEAVWKIDVKDFPAFIVVDDKGNDFFKQWLA